MGSLLAWLRATLLGACLCGLVGIASATSPPAPAAIDSTITGTGTSASASASNDSSSTSSSPSASRTTDINIESSAQARALARAHSAVVGLHSLAVDDAVSNRTLGRKRHGSGVLIDDDGSLILTIGYLILENEQVLVELNDGQVYPARVTAYDPASGFGLVESLTPLPRPAAPFGQATALATNQPLMIASGGIDGSLSVARLVSNRPFTGYWEYHIDAALFTSPPRTDHPGAGLFNADGELLGIGALVVNNTREVGTPALPGNMFVPIDLLKPILAELRQHGISAASQRAWLGINCIENEGEVRLTRITKDGPADAAGLQPGDAVLAVDGTAVQAVEAFYKQVWQGPSPNREISLEIRRDGVQQVVKVQATDRRHSLRRATGI